MVIEDEDRQVNPLQEPVSPHVDAPRIDTTAVDGPEEDDPTRGERLKQKAYEKVPDKLKNANDLQIRFRTGAVYIILTLIGIFAGDIACAIMLSITAGICAGEFYYMLRNDAKLPNELLGIIGAVAYPITMYLGGMAGLAITTLLLGIALLVWYVFYMRARIGDVCISLFGALYCGALMGSLMLIRPAVEAPFGGVMLFIIFGSVWLNDGMAYLFGKRFGKHKMAPRVSPKKTWEGFAAGIVASMAFWCLMVLVPGVNISVVEALLAGLLVGIMSVIGDLAESRIKRNSGVKDSGTIMPGHGGLLDRSDSMFLAAVTSALLLLISGSVPYVF